MLRMIRIVCSPLLGGDFRIPAKAVPGVPDSEILTQ
jgi:hypothetical protein